MSRLSLPDEDPETAEGVLKQLCRSLQLLASPAQAPVSHFPVQWIVLTGEMALDLNHWAGCVSTYWLEHSPRYTYILRVEYGELLYNSPG